MTITPAGGMATRDLIASLAERFPEDADDLNEALEELQRQKLGNCERLSRLSDSHWQRLGLPLGIESLIRDELSALSSAATSSASAAASSSSSSVAAAAANAAPPVTAQRQQQPPPQFPRPASSAEEDSDDGEPPLEPFNYEAEQGLRRRGGGGGNGSYKPQRLTDRKGGGMHQEKQKQQALLSPLDLTPPPDLEHLWTTLLEDTLPPDKRPSLQATWDVTTSDHDRYMLFLEYSSYLRKPEISEEEKAERRKQFEPLMRELGVRPEDDEESQSAVIWWLLIGIIVLVCGFVYFVFSRPEPAHDLQAL